MRFSTVCLALAIFAATVVAQEILATEEWIEGVKLRRIGYPRRSEIEMRANELKFFRADAIVDSPTDLHIVKAPLRKKKAVKEGKEGKKGKKVTSGEKEKRLHKYGHNKTH
ncbi:hypothetical protein BGZ74_007760 [Mortierella antarctica]|nr:hypothetical protein BGZ74_007760 [Mortierella antarctica]